MIWYLIFIFCIHFSYIKYPLNENKKNEYVIEDVSI